ncbi:Gfo/Idh/MocA family oxidoreductase [Candidatus Parcubacteria bacterium]|nr:Gfo/Idh/MocA family oxidoreductase [Candidatus Parcubacteria bacterium]
MANVPSILLVGAGRWGRHHLRVLIELQSKKLCNFVGVYHPNKERIQYLEKEFGIETFSNEEEALEKTDAVDIAIPAYNHFAVAKKMLLARKDVLLEKPLAETITEARELDAIHRNSSQVFMLGNIFRYNPAVDFVKKLLVNEEIGNIRFLRGHFIGFRYKEKDSGILATTAVHFIYLSNYFLDRLPQSVWAKTDYLLDPVLDDHCLVRLNYDPEFSIIESDFFAPEKSRTMDIVGTHGAICLDAISQKVVLHQKKHICVKDRFEISDEGTSYPNIEYQEPLYLELTHFLECVRNRTEPLTSIADGINTMQIIEAAYQSSRLDKTVTIQAK